MLDLIPANNARQVQFSRWMVLFLYGVMALSGSANAQENPINAPPPQADAAKKAVENPLLKLVIPAYVKPGMRFVFNGSSVSMKGTGEGPMRYDVVAVTDSRVLMNSVNYVKYGFDGKIGVSSSAGVDVRSGVPGTNSIGSIWVSKEALAAMAADNTMTVAYEKWPINGRSYDAVILVKQIQDSAQRTIYDRETGLLLGMQLATGKMRQDNDLNIFNRENSSILSYQTARQLDLPWFKADAPKWTKTVKRMKYQGQSRLSGGGVAQDIVTAQSKTAEITDRGDDWAIIKSTSESQGVTIAKDTLSNGPATIGGYWINPDALNKMKQGVVDEDPTLHSVLTFQIQEGAVGKLGVLVETNADRSYQLVWGYSLDDGALMYSMVQDSSMQTTTEFKLVGRE